MAPKGADLIGKHIQYKFKKDEVDEATGDAKSIQYTGKVVCLDNGNKTRMVWDDEGSIDSDIKL